MADLTSSGTSIQFDFINDERFRNALTCDYGELVRCTEIGAWKAVHVLAGSIVEALLVEFLVVSDYAGRCGNDPMKMDLAEAIQACRAEGVLSQRASDLASVIRGYRNLIHPGRVVRLQEKIDCKTGAVAKALVDIVIDEVTAGKADKYGFTAVQIVNKLIKDSSATALLPHFLKETSEFERVRLLTHVVPEQHFELLNKGDMGTRAASDLQKCFRQTFITLIDANKAVVAKQFIRILKEADEEQVFRYETAFFTGADLNYLSKDEAALVKAHVLARMGRSVNPPIELLDVLIGIGRHLDKKEIVRLTDALLRIVLHSNSDALKTKAHGALIGAFWEIPQAIDANMTQRVDAWITALEGRDMTAQAELVKQIKIEIEPPESPPPDS